MNIEVRVATIDDAESIAGLVSLLGHPTSSEQMRARLVSILADDDYATLVACDGERVVGFAGTRVGPMYESDRPYGQILALAVAADISAVESGGR